MVVAKEVKDINGRVILPPGQKLTEKHLKIFKKWGINQVHIKDKRLKEKQVKKVKKNRRKKPNRLALYVYPHVAMPHSFIILFCFIWLFVGWRRNE